MSLLGGEIFAPIELANVGDEVRIAGEWVAIERMQGSPDEGRYLWMVDGRVFQVRPRTMRRMRGPS